MHATLAATLVILLVIGAFAVFWYASSSLEKRAAARLQKVVDAMNGMLPKAPKDPGPPGAPA